MKRRILKCSLIGRDGVVNGIVGVICGFIEIK